MHRLIIRDAYLDGYGSLFTSPGISILCLTTVAVVRYNRDGRALQP